MDLSLGSPSGQSTNRHSSDLCGRRWSRLALRSRNGEAGKGLQQLIGVFGAIGLTFLALKIFGMTGLIVALYAGAMLMVVVLIVLAYRKPPNL